MIVKLVPATEIEIGMYIKGSDSWHPIKELKEHAFDSGRVHIRWVESGRYPYTDCYHMDALVLVGVDNG